MRRSAQRAEPGALQGLKGRTVGSGLAAVQIAPTNDRAPTAGGPAPIWKITLSCVTFHILLLLLALSSNPF